MTVESIMPASIVTLSMNDTFGGGLNAVAQRRIRSLPVADDRGACRGAFGLFDIPELRLPRAALLAGHCVPVQFFLAGSRGNCLEKLKEAARRPISGVLDDGKISIVYPDAPVEEAALLLRRRRAPPPAAGPKSRKWPGAVTAWEMLPLLRA